MPHGIKIGNSYAEALGELYEKMPKAVLAAIAVSYATQGGDYLDEAKERVMDEWKALHANGIVPQKPVA
jgi:hypothetical protein